MEKTLRELFLEYIRTAPKTEQSYTTLNGVDISWSKKLKAWKVDMATSIPEFLTNNPDIAEKIKLAHPDIDLAKLTPRDILKRGIGDEVFNQLIKATDGPDATAFIGQQLRNVGKGTMSGKAKNKVYERFANEKIKTGARRYNIIEGGGVLRKPAIQAPKVGEVVFGATKTGKAARILGISPFLGGVAKAADIYVFGESSKQFKEDPNLKTGVQASIDAIGLIDPTPISALAGIAWSSTVNRAIGE